MRLRSLLRKSMMENPGEGWWLDWTGARIRGTRDALSRSLLQGEGLYLQESDSIAETRAALFRPSPFQITASRYFLGNCLFTLEGAFSSRHDVEV